MTDINADHHHSGSLHELGKLYSDGLSSNLRVDLLHDVGGNRHVHPFGGAPQEALAHEVEVGEDHLDVVVVTLVVQDADDEGVRWMDLLTLQIGYDRPFSLQDFLKFVLIIVSTKRKFLDVIHLDLELALALLEAAPGILHGVTPYVIGVYHYQVLLGDV